MHLLYGVSLLCQVAILSSARLAETILSTFAFVRKLPTSPRRSALGRLLPIRSPRNAA